MSLLWKRQKNWDGSMNWPKLKEEYPKCHDELMILHEMTGLEGESLIDEYFIFHNKDKPLMRLPLLREIEDSLPAPP